MNINEEYNLWLQHTADNQELQQELVAMQNNKAQIEDAFYCELVCILSTQIPQKERINSSFSAREFPYLKLELYC